ncbi:MAG: mechanosensitive ion channel family protein [Elainellaceae cyanobacterium]
MTSLVGVWLYSAIGFSPSQTRIPRAIAQTAPPESASPAPTEADLGEANPSRGQPPGAQVNGSEPTPDAEANETDGVSSEVLPGNQLSDTADPICTLSSHSVRIEGYDKILFCIEAWFQGSSPQARVERVKAQIDAIVAGRIDLHTLGILQGAQLDQILALPASEAGNGVDGGQAAAGIVSSMPSLRERDRLILIVTPTDVHLEQDATSTAAVAAARLAEIQAAASQASDQTSWVTFDWGPYWPWRWRDSVITLSEERVAEEADSGLETPRDQERLFPVQKSNNFFNAAYRGNIITDGIRERARPFSGAGEPLAVVTDDASTEARLVAGDRLLMTVSVGDYEQAAQILTFADVEGLTAPLNSCTAGAGLTTVQTPADLAQLYCWEIQHRVNRYRRIYLIHGAIAGVAIALTTMSIALREWSSRHPGAALAPRFWGWAAFILAFLTGVIATLLPVVPRRTILNAVFSAFASSWAALVNYFFDDFFELAVIVVLAWLTLQGLRRVVRLVPATAARRSMLFYGVALLVVAFAVVVASPHLPGAGTAYLAGVSAFAVLAFSLSAQAAIGDVIAGFVLVFLTDLEKGNWVRIGEVTGELVEQNLFVHKIRTPKNVVVTLQNNTVLSSLISNFSASKKDDTIAPLILHTTVTLGYDVPWRKVHQVLLRAAEKTPGIHVSPTPFILQTSLDDYYVSYELNAHTDQVKQLPRLYSHLHENIQDECNHADIEILSPHYRAVRDGSEITIPADDWAGVVREEDGSHHVNRV